jgi:hypothetical protein
MIILAAFSCCVNLQQNNNELVVQVNILDINSTSVYLEYLIVNLADKNDDQFDLVVNSDDLDTNYTLTNFYYTLNGDLAKQLSIRQLRDRILITNLTSSSQYKVLFTLEYAFLGFNITNKTFKSDLITFFTLNKCNCKLSSTINDEDCESGGNKTCKCKDCYEGASCDQCKTGCYLNRKTNECEKCLCDVNKSNGECEMGDSSIIKCTLCHLPYIGDVCEDCDVYYFKSKERYCMPCMCSDNTSPMASRHCNDMNGN